MVNWAIVVGINNYHRSQDLNYAKRDAEAMRDWFVKEAKFERVYLFTEDSPPISFRNDKPILTQPTYLNLRTFLRVQFEKRIDKKEKDENKREKTLLQSGDNLWFFFAGHGIRAFDGDYLMLLDSDPDDIERSAISVNYVTERLRSSGAGNVILFLDACRNEGGRNSLGIGDEKHQGVVTFYSCYPSQKSYEIKELEHGSFTKALLEGLRIQGENNCATVERLERYLQQRVPEINQKYRQPTQFPYVKPEPGKKLYLILLPKFANFQDIITLKNNAFKAEIEGDLELAEQLWTQLVLSFSDSEALAELKRIWIKQLSSVSVSAPVTQATGSRSHSELDDRTDWFEFEVVQVNIKGEIEKREKQKARFFTEDLGNGVTLDMVYIPGGTFTMGSPESEERYEGYDGEEEPQHQVTIKPFFMGKYPITQVQWKAVASLPQVNRELNPDPSRFKGENLPVECVSWYDAVEFCDRLSQKAKREYRLPGEAEWEYACRAGTTTPFHFGQTITTDLANYRGTDYEEYKWSGSYGQGPKGIYREKTTPVGSFNVANAFGLFDMHGNVWEWCADHWHDNYEGKPSDITIWLSSDNNELRLLRGGSWINYPDFCRSAYRFYYDAGRGYDYLGFRVVCAAAWTQ